MGTLDYTLVFDGVVYVAGDEVPDDVVSKVENPATTAVPVAEDVHPKPTDKKDVWLMYAISLGVAVPDGATKQDIVDAVSAYEADQAGPPAPVDES